MKCKYIRYTGFFRHECESTCGYLLAMKGECDVRTSVDICHVTVAMDTRSYHSNKHKSSNQVLGKPVCNQHLRRVNTVRHLFQWCTGANTRMNPIPIGTVCLKPHHHRRWWLNRRRQFNKVNNALFSIDAPLTDPDPAFLLAPTEDRSKISQYNEVVRPGSDTSRSIGAAKGPLTFIDRQLNDGGSPAIKSSTRE